jgi:acyl-CoA reductase-like NAD-dependent aldehyde dehydrogenase
MQRAAVMDALIAEYRATGTLAGLPQGHWIDGRFCPSVSARRMDSADPGTGHTWLQFAAGDSDDVEKAVVSSDHALRSVWRQVPPAERGRILQRAAQGLPFNHREPRSRAPA